VNQEKREWFKVLFSWKSSVVPAIFPRVLFCGGFSFFISLLYQWGIPLALPDVAGGIVPSIVLGLLLVFRTNTAYDRFWEGRKAWGTAINTVRNLARTMWISIAESQPEDRNNKILNMRLLVAFAVATKLRLRGEPINWELIDLMPSEYYEKLKLMNNPPLELAFWIGDYLQQQYRRGNINAYQLTAMSKLLDVMVDVLGICERILKTPIPLAYSIHLKQLLLIYCLILPFELVDELQLLTAPLASLISFMIFGIEEIGIEIENPFGRDSNDLPLDDICRTMQVNIEDLISLTPSVRYSPTTDSLGKN
jgi:putative membrane protein